MAAVPLDAVALFNRLQARKSWPEKGPPMLFDVRDADAYAARRIRGAHRASLSADGEVVAPDRRAQIKQMACWQDAIRGTCDFESSQLDTARHDRFVTRHPVPPFSRSWWDQAICFYDDLPDNLEDHPVVRAFIKNGLAREISVLTVGFKEFSAEFPCLCAKGDSRSAMKRPPPFPSCILPGFLFLGDLEDAAALPRLREQLNIKHVVTALADPPPTLKESVNEARVKHVWCNVRDVEGADIKEHFDKAFNCMERARAASEAVLVHCSRGVSRSASLVIAYLMKRDKMSAQVLPNDGFWRCLLELEKELAGERSGVYVPIKTKRLEDMEFELPPAWAAQPTHTDARLLVVRDGETLETLSVGEEPMYVFGRSLTCDFQLEHPSASRQHAVLVHHENGHAYIVDLKSSHGTWLNDKRLRPHEATLLREGAEIVFGASSRRYRVVGVTSRDKGRAPVDLEAGPQLPGALRPADDGASASDVEEAGSKRKMHPKKWAKKKRRWLAGPKPRAKQSENERVAMGAGAGSGCMGPGEY